MIVSTSTIRSACARPRGLTLVEMVISIVLVAVLLLAALNMLGSASLGQRTTDGQRRGNQLAQDLMNEILLQPYAEETDPDSFGLEGIENVPLDRSLYDDVDDYNGNKGNSRRAK